MYRYPFIAFFSSAASFESKERILQQQTFALLIISFFFGLGVLAFAPVRLYEGNLLVGVSQLCFGCFLLYGFFRLKHDKAFYKTYSAWFMLLFLIYTLIIFFNVPQNHLNILWAVSAPILVFFFLDRIGGIVMFVIVSLFILYLIVSDYPYTVAEYVTLIASFLISSFVMLTYERVKDGERHRLVHYNQTLQQEVDRKTQDLRQLNETLEQRVKEEFEKRLSQEQMLLQQCRLASMGEMIDAIAHQWRQPLMHINAVLMNLEQSIDSHTLSEKSAQEKIDELSRLTEYMSGTIEDFRHLFKKEKERTHFNPTDVIQHALSIMKNRLGGIKVILNDQNGKLLSAHRGELFQVIMTLLENAIEVLDQTKPLLPTIKITIKDKDDNMIIRVEDNGGGIMPEKIQKIFDPYYTTKDHTGGSGLGLYIAKIIIEQNMCGTITVSNTDEGAAFVLKIPLMTKKC